MINGWVFFWTAIAIGCMLWYSTVTLYIAVRGVLDIQSMLAHLKKEQDNETAESRPIDAA